MADTSKKTEQTVPMRADGLSRDISYTMWKRGMVGQDQQPAFQAPRSTN